ncbi:hypothetical protein Pint_25602 [Pistacia integerrima]|uniref:Uncharacterized protein n=1 Tax=Pistacia integerrima TaxID=434235 RepID=A0ACC0YCC1_9ROSI|nr:hypothetical protein Pint_25602 [Pistacia integerrima]
MNKSQICWIQAKEIIR